MRNVPRINYVPDAKTCDSKMYRKMSLEAQFNRLFLLFLPSSPSRLNHVGHRFQLASRVRRRLGFFHKQGIKAEAFSNKVCDDTVLGDLMFRRSTSLPLWIIPPLIGL